MARFFTLSLLALALTACGHELENGAPTSDAPANEARDLVPAANNGADASDDDASDDDAADDSDDDAADDDSDDAADEGSDDAADDAPPEPAGPPPADAGQSCSEWTDCGPWYVNENSGFDCEANACVCNAAGTYDEACAAINGVWSDEDCFCYVGASPMPSEDADEWEPSDDDEYEYDDADEDPRANRVCWWRWRDRCEADVYVDTSSYEYECNGDECDYVYRESGYWESGHCSGYWIRRCDDGTERRY